MRIRELAIVVALAACGCNAMFNGWLDPTQLGRFRSKSAMHDLRRSVSVADEPTAEIEATEPTSDDLKVQMADYTLQPGDVIDVSIFELMVPGQPWVETRQISWEGFITIPQLRQDVQASGKTARGLEKYLKSVLQESQVLAQPEVTILIREARSMTYNILGAVGTPRSDMLPRPNFRVMDALATAGGVNPVGGPKQPLVKTVYVFRNMDRMRKAPVTTGPTVEPSEGEVRVNFAAIGNGGTAGDEGGHWVYTNGEWKFIKEPSGPSAEPAPKAPSAPQVRAPTPAPRPKAPSTAPAPRAAKAPATVGPSARVNPPAESHPAGESWEDLAIRAGAQRILAIPLDKLEVGDPRYNVVIRDGDTIWVPPPMQGEFYVMGNVLRPGVFSLTGREVTIRQAVTAAGGLAPLADPSRAELVRRIGGNQEQVLFINVDRIFGGQEPDIILKPDDILNVGSNPLMPFLAVLRNAFRATYGFGFVYDRNFADIDSFSSQANPTDIRRAQRAQLLGILAR